MSSIPDCSFLISGVNRVNQPAGSGHHITVSSVVVQVLSMIAVGMRFPWQALLSFVVLWCPTARAQDASPWVDDTHSSLRLLAGSRTGNVLLAGIAIRLQPGWKTYWRYPGDSGVPPRFDFSKSDNVEAVTVLWPAPGVFDDGAGGQSIGYRGQVILPLRVVAKAPDKPVRLHAIVSYAVCEKICVPVDAEAELAITSIASAQDAALFAALDAVPKPASIGDPNPLTVRNVRRDGPSQVAVDVVAPDANASRLFVEGPTPEWALPIPRPARDNPAGVQRFVFDLDGIPQGVTISGVALRFTLIGGDKAYEFIANLD